MPGRLLRPQPISPDGLRVVAELLANNYTQAGVTFDVGGVERPFPLDLVPRVIASPEWEIIGPASPSGYEHSSRSSPISTPTRG